MIHFLVNIALVFLSFDLITHKFLHRATNCYRYSASWDWRY